MRRLAVLVAMSALFVEAPSRAFVTPNYRAEPVDIVGTYDDSGTGLNGAPGVPDVVGTVTKVSQDLYRISEVGPHGQYDILCIRTGDHLGCGWARAGSAIAVASFRFDGAHLEGRLFDSDDAHFARAAFDVAGAVDGSFVSTKLENAAPATSLEMWASAIGAASPLVHRVELDYVNAAMPYRRVELAYGILDRGFFDLGIAAFGWVGAASYSIEDRGRVLRGTWMDSARPEGGTGLDVLTRR